MRKMYKGVGNVRYFFNNEKKKELTKRVLTCHSRKLILGLTGEKNGSIISRPLTSTKSSVRGQNVTKIKLLFIS